VSICTSFNWAPEGFLVDMVVFREVWSVSDRIIGRYSGTDEML